MQSRSVIIGSVALALAGSSCSSGSRDNAANAALQIGAPLAIGLVVVSAIGVHDAVTGRLSSMDDAFVAAPARALTPRERAARDRWRARCAVEEHLPDASAYDEALRPAFLDGFREGWRSIVGEGDPTASWYAPESRSPTALAWRAGLHLGVARATALRDDFVRELQREADAASAAAR